MPFHPIYHPFNWRGWLDWGTGALGDMGAHLIDHPYWALGLKYPTSIEATSTPWGMDSKNQPASYPLAMQAVYHFPARGSQPPVKMTWCDGGLMPGRPDALPESVTLDRGGGVILIGEKGILLHGTYGGNPRLFPASLMEEARRVPKTHPPIQTADGPKRSAPHRMNWIDAIRERSKTTCPFEYAGPLTETMLLGVVALRTGQGKRIDYDGESREDHQRLRGQPVPPSRTPQGMGYLARGGWRDDSAHRSVDPRHPPRFDTERPVSISTDGNLEVRGGEPRVAFWKRVGGKRGEILRYDDLGLVMEPRGQGDHLRPVGGLGEFVMPTQQEGRSTDRSHQLVGIEHVEWTVFGYLAADHSPPIQERRHHDEETFLIPVFRSNQVTVASDLFQLEHQPVMRPTIEFCPSHRLLPTE